MTEIETKELGNICASMPSYPRYFKRLCTAPEEQKESIRDAWKSEVQAWKTNNQQAEARRVELEEMYFREKEEEDKAIKDRAEEAKLTAIAQRELRDQEFGSAIRYVLSEIADIFRGYR